MTASRAAWGRLGRWALRLLGIGLPALILWNIDWRALMAALGASDWPLAVVAGACNFFVISLGRAQRFGLLLRPAERPGLRARFLDVLLVTTAARTLNTVLPARAGDGLRVVEMNRRFQMPMRYVVAAIGVETALEVISLAAIALVPFVAGVPLGGLRAYLLPIFGVGAAGLGLLLAVAGLAGLRRRRARRRDRRAAVRPGEAGAASGPAGAGPSGALAAASAPRGRLAALLGRVGEPFRVLHAPRLWALAFAWTLLVDVADLAMIGLCLRALHLGLPPLEWFVLLAGINVAILLPVPGHVGTLEAGVVLVLGALGVEPSRALAFALVYHLAHLLPVVLLGSLGLLRGRRPR